MPATIPGRDVRHMIGRRPAMSETKYDRVTSAQTAVAVALGVLVLLLLAIWFSIQQPDTRQSNDQVVRSPGQLETDQVDDLRAKVTGIESPDDSTDDLALDNAQDFSHRADLPTQLSDQIGNLADSALELPLNPPGGESTSRNSPASISGTGRSPFGAERDIRGHVNPESRWVVQFANSDDLNAYARQLDFFGIELACAFPDGRIYYVSNLSSSLQLREGKTDSADDRLFLTWEGGDRQQADIELLSKAGVPDAARGTALHFYNAATEQLLARLEREYGGHSPLEIRRTYFQVRRTAGTTDGADYEFVVTGQKLN